MFVLSFGIVPSSKPKVCYGSHGDFQFANSSCQVPNDLQISQMIIIIDVIIHPFIILHFQTKNDLQIQDGAPKIAFSCLISGWIRVYRRCNELVNGCFHGLYKPTFTSLGGHTIQICARMPNIPVRGATAAGPWAECIVSPRKAVPRRAEKQGGWLRPPKNMRKTRRGKWWFNQFKPEKLWLKHQTWWFHWRNICIQVSKHGRFEAEIGHKATPGIW